MIWFFSMIIVQIITTLSVFAVLFAYIRIDEYFFYRKIRKNNDKNKRKNQTC